MTFSAQKCNFLGFFGSNFSNLDIFGRKNLIFSGFESAKIHILAIFKVPKTFLEGHLFENLVPLCMLRSDEPHQPRSSVFCVRFR